ncbi:MAG: FAD-binding oxidoreductase [Pseudomonadota bacterium]
MHQTALAEIHDALGPSGVVDPEETAPYATDILGQGEAPLAVARPASTAEVADLLRICQTHELAVVPQGGNTNVCRMAVPLRGQAAVLVSLRRMNRILSVDPDQGTLTAEAGCLLQTVQEAAAARGACFAPDWGARGTATLGGAVATNGGGLNVLRYGTTREQVLGMEVVLPDGRVWDGLRALRKDNSGYDLKQLFIGSEGTLGIITRLVFRLHRAQPLSQSMLAAANGLDALIPLLTLAQRIGGEALTAFELMSGNGIALALERYPDLKRPLNSLPEWSVLIRFSGNAPQQEQLMNLFEAALEEGLVSDAILAQSGAQEANLWELREQMIPGQYFPNRPWLKWDASVPLSQIAPFLAEARDIVQRLLPGAEVHTVGHVGDGNLHFSVFPRGPIATEDETELLSEIDRLLWRMGGSIVAEHGVGAAFAERIRGQKSGLEFEMMARIKAAFDPDGRMNPGKLLVT